jgi:hypothetical protein
VRALDEELRIAERTAQAISNFKASSATNPSQLIQILRQGWIAATEAGSGPTLSTTSPLNAARTEVGFAFPNLVKALETGDNAQHQKIETALNAANVWVDRLKVELTL